MFKHNLSEKVILEEIICATDSLEKGEANYFKVSSLIELKQAIQVNDNLLHKFVLGDNDQLIVNSVPKDNREGLKKMSHAALAELCGISSVKTAGYIKAINSHVFAVSDWSGHFTPSLESHHHIKLHLLEWGLYTEFQPNIHMD